MSPDHRVPDEVFTARLGLGLRELDGREEAPDVSSTVANRLATEAPREERARIRHWPLLAALLAVFVTAALWLQHRNGRAPADDTPALAQDPQPTTAQQVLTYAIEPNVSGMAPSREDFQLTVVAMQQRLSGLATVRPHGAQLLVTTATADLERVRGLVEGDARLELRPVATADYAADGIRFDLHAERKRLQGWLDAGGRDRLRSDLGAVRDYRDAGAGVRWIPRVIRTQPESDEHWSFRQVDIPSLAAATVAAHTDADWNSGMLPLHMLALPPAQRFLIELTAINTHADFVNQDDLDAASYQRQPAPQAHKLRFATKPEARAKYAQLGELCLDRHLAILWDDELLATPLVISRLPATGMIECDSAVCAETMQSILSNPIPFRLRFLGAEPVPK